MRHELSWKNDLISNEQVWHKKYDSSTSFTSFRCSYEAHVEKDTCSFLWQDCPAGRVGSARVQLLPGRGLVWSCCLVETDNARGKALPRWGMMISSPMPFSIGYSMEENAVMGENVPNSPFLPFFFPVSSLGCVLGKVCSCSQYCPIYTELHCAKCSWPEHCVTSTQPTVRMDWRTVT